jgi:hypothetical protein
LAQMTQGIVRIYTNENNVYFCKSNFKIWKIKMFQNKIAVAATVHAVLHRKKTVHGKNGFLSLLSLQQQQ